MFGVVQGGRVDGARNDLPGHDVLLPARRLAGEQVKLQRYAERRDEHDKVFGIITS